MDVSLMVLVMALRMLSYIVDETTDALWVVTNNYHYGWYHGW